MLCLFSYHEKAITAVKPSERGAQKRQSSPDAHRQFSFSLSSLLHITFMFARATRNALASSSRPTFRFRGCLNAPKDISRSLSRHAAQVSVPAPPSSDDADIIADFDLPQGSQRYTGLKQSGLFGHAFLTSPLAFVELADSTLLRAKVLTQRIVRARESRGELFRVVKNLDRLSDLLCGVIDLAELVRNAHPDPEWVQSAEHVYEKMCEFMNVLNTHVDLYLVRTPGVVQYNIHLIIYPVCRSSERCCQTQKYHGRLARRLEKRR
jgi:hypothetical protein